MELRVPSGLGLVVGVSGAASVTDRTDPFLPGWGLWADDRQPLNKYPCGILLDRRQ